MLPIRTRVALIRLGGCRSFSFTSVARIAPTLYTQNKLSNSGKRSKGIPSAGRKSPLPKPSASEAASNALQRTSTHDDNNLMSAVNIPHDQYGILKPDHPAATLLANSSIVIQRQLEMMNVFLGFEQANKYVIMDPQGSTIGYLAEQEHGIANMMARQLAKTHRSFTTHVFDKNEREVLRFHRPFSWISSRIRVYDAISTDASELTTSSALQGTSVGAVTTQTSATVSSLSYGDMRIIGEAQQQWAPLRRKYNLFLHREINAESARPNAPKQTSGDLPLSNSTALQVVEAGKENVEFSQFASVDEPFLSWDFALKSEDERLIGSVNRNFSGFAREIFTDTGVYALRMDAASLTSDRNDPNDPNPSSEAVGMTLDQRAVMLATAVSIDFDYFSRHSGAVGGGGFGFFPMWFPGMGGGAAAEGGAVAGGAAEAGTGAIAGAAERGVGGAAAGAGTMAGYEAMQRGRGGDAQDSQSPQDPQSPYGDPQSPQDPWNQGENGNGDAWWNGSNDQSNQNDPWGQSGSQPPSSGGGGGEGGGGGGGGDGGGSFFDDLF